MNSYPGLREILSEIIGLILKSRHIGFQIVMQISHLLCRGQTLATRQIAENRLVEILN